LVSGWMITKNAMRAGYPIVEAILAVLPLCDEFVVMNDSVDSTEEVLERMRQRYGKIRVVNRPWPFREYRDHALAIATQWGMDECQGDWLIYVQADEVFHESAIPGMRRIIEESTEQAVAFHRMQLSENFQTNHAEHAVTRMAKRGAIQAAGDALSFAVKDDRYLSFDPLGHFSLFDITRCFAGNFPGKAYGQAEIWHHLPNRNKDGWFGKTPEEWAVQIREWDATGYPELWTRKTSPFMDILPTSMKRWVGEVRYQALPELVD
jgi:glycosyltransferase involved in cell wall biosynthesis